MSSHGGLIRSNEIHFIFSKFHFFHFNLLEFHFLSVSFFKKNFYADLTIRECVLLMWMNKNFHSLLKNNKFKFNDSSNIALRNASDKQNNAYTI